MTQDVLRDTEAKMQKSIQNLQSEMTRIRTGRANVALVDSIKVDYYGTPTPLKQIASIGVPEPRLIVIQPWDASACQAIEKAIQKADIGLSPQSDGKVIRVPVPQLTEERRRELVKLVKRTGEECKVTIRKHRRDANEELKEKQKNKEITEDELKRFTEKVQELTDKYVAKVDEILQAKEKEIMEI